MYTLGISKTFFKRIAMLQSLYFIPKEITISCTDTTLAKAHSVCRERILGWKSSTWSYCIECQTSIQATDYTHVYIYVYVQLYVYTHIHIHVCI